MQAILFLLTMGGIVIASFLLILGIGYIIGEICDIIDNFSDKKYKFQTKRKQWKSWYDEALPHMKFEDFKKIYSLNPSRWQLSYSIYHISENQKLTRITFNYKDYKKYCKFLKTKEKYDKKQGAIKRDAQIVSIIEQAQQDIIEIKQQIAQDQLEAVNLINKITK